MLCAIPALRALRQLNPSARIVLVGLPWIVQLLPRFAHLIDRTVIFPGHPELPEREPEIGTLPGFLSRLRSLKADLAIQMHGSGEISNRIVKRFGARRTVGFSRGKTRPEGFIDWPEQGHELQRCLMLVRTLGATAEDESLEFPVIADDVAELAATGLPAALQGQDYVCIHAGARSAERRWPADCFARVADALAVAGFKIVLTGSHAEQLLAEQVRCQMQYPALNAALPCSLGALAALLRDAKLLVCNDTGVSHLAVALGLPSVVVFTGSDPDRWAPLDRALHPIFIDHEGHRANEVIAACLRRLSSTEQSHL